MGTLHKNAQSEIDNAVLAAPTAPRRKDHLQHPATTRRATLGWIAEDYVAHLKHHLNQIVGQMFETNYGMK